MKKSLVLIAVSLMAVTVFAQSPTEQGRVIADISLDLDFGTTEFDGSDMEVDHDTIDMDVRLGYTIIDDLEVGIFLGLADSSIDMGDAGKTESNATFYGAFAQYYFLSGVGLRPFVGLAAGLGSMENPVEADKHEHDIVTFSVSAGAAYFVNEHFGVELTGEFVTTTFDDDDDVGASVDMDATAFQIALGTIVSF